MRGHRDLRLVVAAAIACALLAALAPVEAVSLVFAAPLSLFLPGYAIVAATFAREPLAAPMKLVLSAGLSLATLALGAIVLDFAPGGIRGTSWTLLLLLVVVASCRGAALRRPAVDMWHLNWPLRTSRTGAAMVLGGLLASIVALSLAFTTLPAKDAIGYTELWMQPLSAGGASGVTVGVGSNEQQKTAYRLHLLVGGSAPSVVRRFALEPGESRILRVEVEPGTVPESRPAVAKLFREARPGRPYRRASTWLPDG